MGANEALTATKLAAGIGNHLVPALDNHTAPAGERGVIREQVSRALSLKPRGGVGKDELVVRNLSASLRVVLLARPIHPWDRDRPAHERNELFVQQCLEDVSIAIPKLFRNMAEISEIEVTVLHPRNKRAIMVGIVNRGDALTPNGLPAGMKLRAMGLEYGRNNSGFEAIDENSAVAVK